MPNCTKDKSYHGDGTSHVKPYVRSISVRLCRTVFCLGARRRCFDVPNGMFCTAIALGLTCHDVDIFFSIMTTICEQNQELASAGTPF